MTLSLVWTSTAEAAPGLVSIAASASASIVPEAQCQRPLNPRPSFVVNGKALDQHRAPWTDVNLMLMPSCQGFSSRYCSCLRLERRTTRGQRSQGSPHSMRRSRPRRLSKIQLRPWSHVASRRYRQSLLEVSHPSPNLRMILFSPPQTQ